MSVDIPAESIEERSVPTGEAHLASGDPPPIIRVEGLCKSYPTVEAVRGISFEVRAGEVFGLIGPNGAGKTTTLECLVGLRRPTAGLIRVLGISPAAGGSELRRKLAVQPQEGTLFPQLKVGETVRLWASFYPSPLPVAQVLSEVGLSDQVGHRVKALSGGQRRRLLLAVCIVGNPEVLVLDEPASGLDPSARELLWNVVRELRSQGRAVLLTTHDMTEAEQLCDRIGVIVAGRLVAAGTPGDLVRQLGGTTTVSFTTGSLAGVVAIRRLPAAAAVRTETVGGRIRVSVSTADGDEVLRAVAGTAEIEARDVSVTHGGLDEVFKKLVRGAKDDAS